MGDYRNTVTWAAGVVCVAAMAMGCAPSTATDATPADLFRGQTVRIIVGFPAGGGYDLHARVLAGALSRHLPGSPAVVVENMPGAGGLIAANHLAFRARSDGLTIGFIGGSMVLPQLIGDPGARYDVRAFPAVGAPTVGDVDVCLASASSGLTLDTWRQAPVAPRIGISAYGTRGHAGAVLIASALGLPIRLVPGYGGTADLALAMDRGEVDVSCMGWIGYQATLEPTGRYSVVFQSGESSAPPLKDVPSAARLVSDERGQALVGVLASLAMLERYFALPPGTPRDMVDVLRAAFDATMRDDEFLQAARAARLDIRPVRGSEIDAQVASLFDLPEDTRRDVTTLLSERGQ